MAIHAGLAWSERGATDERVSHAWAGHSQTKGAVLSPAHPLIARGSVVAITELVDCHPAHGCCEPWGEKDFTDDDGRRRTDIWHLVLENIRLLATPIPAAGNLRLWRPDPDLVEAIRHAA